MVAQVVAAVEDAAGEVGMFVEPGPDGQDGDPGTAPLGLPEQRPGDGGFTLSVKGEGDPGTVTGTVGDLDGLPGVGAGAGAGLGEVAAAGVTEVGAWWAATAPEADPEGEHAAANAPPATSPAPARSTERRSDVVTHTI